MKRLLLAAVVVTASLAAATAATADSEKKEGFKTAAPAMLIGVAPGSSTEAIISTGDMVGGYRFESIPDGIALHRHDNNRVEAYVNHETSLVPFPFPMPPTATTELNAQNDFENAQVSLLTLNRETAGVIDGRLVVTSAENYQRFCSSFLATKAAGFNRPILLTNEEGIDWVKRSGKPWPTTVGAADSRQIGVVVAVDARTGKSNTIWGMGRHNHENSIAVPGYGHPVVLSGDDSFVNNPAQSQVYSYIADSANDVLNDRGELYAFVSDVPGKDDYFDFAPGDTTSIHGHFELVPKDIATGRRPDGTDMMAADKGYPQPVSPAPGVGWQRDAVTGIPIDGPQWVLEHWGDEHTEDEPVFQFVRIEDMAYDRRPGMENVVYLVDSGRGTTGASQPGRSTNGRVWKMVLDKNDPKKVLSLSIFIEGDDAAGQDADRDPPAGQHRVDAAGPADHRGSRVEPAVPADRCGRDDGSAHALHVRDGPHRRRGEGRPVARREHRVAGHPERQGLPTRPGLLGAWESSGVIDASPYFGLGSFLVTVQASTYWVEKALTANDDLAPFGVPDYTHKRNGGQLVLLRLPGWGSTSTIDD